MKIRGDNQNGNTKWGRHLHCFMQLQVPSPLSFVISKFRPYLLQASNHNSCGWLLAVISLLLTSVTTHTTALTHVHLLYSGNSKRP
ncbi:hypothetical protein AEAE_0677 [Aeriscardovia aeriphila]|uniref:Uncharacterized protein n=1 Tax=Aeriscardovia aeriphila TaxID=218139 RepID=A0A261FAK8_9BIFI|nr:hypothetical protein AEAE_0677 [Aeriscardovia aeriphila]